jgi:tRNA nucleotidyltransferase (CCA-adding enzyme)
MADYIYLLQTRLTAAQQTSLQHVREAAKARAMTVFLVGGAVRDLTTGSPIRDLDFAVQGNATKLKKDLQKVGGILLGEDEQTQTLYFNFPGGVRLEVGSTLSATFPKPGKPVYKPSTILDDLRRRDFTANAMALSLNEGSFGLLMDPLNGIGDLENRELRLVSNYGFIEDPARMIRAVRFGARLGWHMEEKTQKRYDDGKTEGYISALNPSVRAIELEEIFHEEDPLRVLRKLEAEGWAKVLTPIWNSKQVNETELSRLRDTVGQLEAMGIHPDPSPAMFPLLTAKLAPKDVTTLKKSFARPGFAEQIAQLDVDTKAFATLLSSKAAAEPSAAWKMLFEAAPEPVLWLAHTTKSAPLQAKFKAFFEVWSQARTKIPYQLMQEMRIVPELPIYAELLDKLFFAIMDGKLDTPEAAKAFLEPYSPPAPPPPVNMRRRAVKKEPKVPKPRTKKVVAPAPAEDAEIAISTDVKPLAAVKAPAVKTPAAKAIAVKAAPVKVVAAKEVAKPAVPAKAVAAKPVPAKKAVKAAAVKPVAKPVAKKVAKVVSKAPAKKVLAKKVVVKKAVTKKAVAKPVAKKAVVKKAVSKKPAPKPVAKKAAKTIAKPKPAAKKVVAKKPVPKKAVPKKAVKKAIKPKGKR